MNENNAVTKEELKEILAEMAKELRAETAVQFDAADKKTAARFPPIPQLRGWVGSGNCSAR